MKYNLSIYEQRSFQDYLPLREKNLYWRERAGKDDTLPQEWRADPRFPQDEDERVPARHPDPDYPPSHPRKPDVEEPRKEPPPLIVG